MTTGRGRIELERVVDSIVVGRRHRSDLGDLDALAASIDRDGLLQPLTVTPDGVLVCGARRLAAIKALGWRTVNVWVRSGVSDRLGQLVAEQNDNVLHKPLSQLEAASLYRELKQVMAEDAARRQANTQFSSERQPGHGDGGAESAPPSPPLGKTRAQAARMVTGTASYSRLEQIGYLQQLAEDQAQPTELRERVRAELQRIDKGAAVSPIYQQVRAIVTSAQAERDADLEALARDALNRVAASAASKRAKRSVVSGGVDQVRYPVRAFVLTWGELASWWLHYDATELAASLTDEQLDSFLETSAGTAAFAAQLRAARENAPTGSTRGHLRAI